MFSLAIAGIFIGVMLGLTGGGGSLLTVPALIYLGDLPIKDAIATSLLIVALTSMFALMLQVRLGNINWRIGLKFSFLSMVGAYLGARIAIFIPELIILGLFYIIMVACGYTMIIKINVHHPDDQSGPHDNLNLKSLKLIAVGLAMGAFTGLVGAGGGFLVVPILVLLTGLSMQIAVGTSLLVVTSKCIAGLIGYSAHATVHYEYVFFLTTIAALGATIGVFAGHRITNKQLQAIFGTAILILAITLCGYESTLALKSLFGLSLKLSVAIATISSFVLLAWLLRSIYVKKRNLSGIN